MNAITEMHGILEQMVESATRRDKQRVLELNTLYRALIPKVYHTPLTQLYFEYDNCRHSCVMSVTMLENLNEQLVSDAKQRLARIPKSLSVNFKYFLANLNLI